MKEIILYAIAAISSIVIFGYTVHMFIGGLVSRELELASEQLNVYGDRTEELLKTVVGLMRLGP